MVYIKSPRACLFFVKTFACSHTSILVNSRIRTKTWSCSWPRWSHGRWIRHDPTILAFRRDPCSPNRRNSRAPSVRQRRMTRRKNQKLSTGLLIDKFSKIQIDLVFQNRA